MHENNAAYESSEELKTDRQFNSYLFADAAVNIINNHDDSEPLFLLLSLPLIHFPVHPDADVLEENSHRLENIPDVWRRRTGGMVIMLDSIVASVFGALTNVIATSNRSDCSAR
jgi:hypothetical protein